MDSFIEVTSGSVLLWRLAVDGQPGRARTKRKAGAPGVCIDSGAAPPMTRFEVANTGRCFNTAEHGDALHRTNESRVIDQDRGDMVASQECTACVFGSHNEPCGAAQQPRCLASLRTSRIHARYQPHRISQT